MRLGSRRVRSLGSSSFRLAPSRCGRRNLARTRQLRWLLLPAGLALLVVGAVGTLILDQGHPSDYVRGVRGPLGIMVAVGYGVCYAATILMVSWGMIAVAAYALAFILDLLPPLRERGLGESIRRAVRSPMRDPQ